MIRVADPSASGARGEAVALTILTVRAIDRRRAHRSLLAKALEMTLLPTSMRRVAVWGGDEGRIPRALSRLVLTSDAAHVYALGNVGDAGVVRVIDASTGATAREHRVAPFALVDGRAVVSLARGDEVLALSWEADSTVVRSLSLRDGTARDVARVAGQPRSVTWRDDGGVSFDSTQPTAPQTGSLLRWERSGFVRVAMRVDGRDELYLTPAGDFGRPLEHAVRHGVAWMPLDPCVSPDGARLACARRGVLWLCDLVTGAESPRVDGHAREVRSLAATRELAAVGGADGDITVRRLADGELLWRFEAGGGTSVSQVALSPDGRSVLALVRCDNDDGLTVHRLRAWSLTEGEEVTPSPMEFSSTARPSCSPDGPSALVCSGHGGHTPVWVDLAAWRDRSLSLQELFAASRAFDASEVDSLASFDDDIAWIIARAPGGLARAITLDAKRGAVQSRADTRLFPRAVRATRGDVFAVLVEPSRQGAGAIEVRRGALSSGLPLPPCEVPAGARVTAVALGDQSVVVGSASGEVWLYDGIDRAPIATVRSGDREVTAMALSPDGRTLLAGTADGRVVVCAVEGIVAPSPR